MIIKIKWIVMAFGVYLSTAPLAFGSGAVGAQRVKIGTTAIIMKGNGSCASVTVTGSSPKDVMVPANTTPAGSPACATTSGEWGCFTAHLPPFTTVSDNLSNCAPNGNQVFTSSQSWTVPANVYQVRAKVWGAGGGGGGAANPGAGTAGGQGGFSTVILPVTPGESLNLVVGTGGGAGNGNTGSSSHGGSGGGGGGHSSIDRAGSYLVISGGGGGGSGADGSNSSSSLGGNGNGDGMNSGATNGITNGANAVAHSTASQATTTVTGTATLFIANMVGSSVLFNNGTSTGLITARASNTSVTATNSQTVAAQGFEVIYNAGTISVVSGSTAVTGTGTAFNAGMVTTDLSKCFIYTAAGAFIGNCSSTGSGTTITLAANSPITYSGAYTLYWPFDGGPGGSPSGGTGGTTESAYGCGGGAGGGASGVASTGGSCTNTNGGTGGTGGGGYPYSTVYGSGGGAWVANSTTYSTGTASQSTTTVTGVGTTWTAAMVGLPFNFANGAGGGIITGFTSATSLTVSNSATVTSQAYAINPQGSTGYGMDADRLNKCPAGNRALAGAAAANGDGGCIVIQY